MIPKRWQIVAKRGPNAGATPPAWLQSCTVWRQARRIYDYTVQHPSDVTGAGGWGHQNYCKIISLGDDFEPSQLFCVEVII